MMRIEIWSDIMCPFCYIGKRNFETALAQSGHANKVEVTWRSFQLQPGLQSDPGKSIYQSLAETKGMSLQQVKQMTAHAGNMAAEVGLYFDFERMKVANTFDAHRLLHLAAKHGLQNQAGERFFKAYFSEAADLSSHELLKQLAADIGLKTEDVTEVLNSDKYAKEVKTDQLIATNSGISGVPFFVINGKYGISGAQPPEVFLQVLHKGWQE